MRDLTKCLAERFTLRPSVRLSLVHPGAYPEIWIGGREGVGSRPLSSSRLPLPFPSPLPSPSRSLPYP